MDRGTWYLQKIAEQATEEHPFKIQYNAGWFEIEAGGGSYLCPAITLEHLMKAYAYILAHKLKENS